MIAESKSTTKLSVLRAQWKNMSYSSLVENFVYMIQKSEDLYSKSNVFLFSFLGKDW